MEPCALVCYGSRSVVKVAKSVPIEGRRNPGGARHRDDQDWRWVEPDPPTPPPIQPPTPPPLTEAERTERIAARTAKQLEALRLAREKRRTMVRPSLEDLTGVSLEVLRKKVTARWLDVALHHLAGFTDTDIAKLLGYRNTDSVKRVRERPEVAALIDKVKERQIEQVIAGEFGVRAQAKAAAPKVMQRVIEKAGAGRPDEKGRPQNVAAKDTDQLAAAKMVLQASGDLVERKEIDVNVVLNQMTDVELRVFVTQGQLPRRLATYGQAMGLPVLEGDPTP